MRQTFFRVHYMGKLKEVSFDPLRALPSKGRWSTFIPTFVRRLQDIFLTFSFCLWKQPMDKAECAVKYTSTNLIPLSVKAWASITYAQDEEMLVWPVKLCGIVPGVTQRFILFKQLTQTWCWPYILQEQMRPYPLIFQLSSQLCWIDLFHDFRTCPCSGVEIPPRKACSLLHIALVTADMFQ